jgi:tellurite resistance protein
MFAIVMGFGGLTIATQKVEQIFAVQAIASTALLIVSAFLWLAVFVAYTLKYLRYPTAVVAELNHPIRLSFFPAASIGLLLLSIATLPVLLLTAQVIWWLGVVAQLGFLLLILDRWFHKEHFRTEHNSPAWFIPVVGNLIVPISGMEFGYVEISFFFFAIGLIFWLPLMAITLNRSFFFAPLPRKLLPTQFILIAPPAVAFISWIKLKDGFDDFSVMLYFFALFLTLMTISQFRRFLKLDFAMSWWAFSFPLAAVTIATIAFHERLPLDHYLWIGLSLFISFVLVMAMLSYRTVSALVKGELIQPE